MLDKHSSSLLPCLSKHMPNNFSNAICAAFVLAICLFESVPIKHWLSRLITTLNCSVSVISSNCTFCLSWLRRSNGFKHDFDWFFSIDVLDNG